MTKIISTKWIGLAEVAVLNDSDILSGDRYGFTNVVGLAKTKTEFRGRMKNKFSSMDLKLLRLEDVEPFADRVKNYKVSKEIINAAKLLSETNTIEFATFYNYTNK